MFFLNKYITRSILIIGLLFIIATFTMGMAVSSHSTRLEHLQINKELSAIKKLKKAHVKNQIETFKAEKQNVVSITEGLSPEVKNYIDLNGEQQRDKVLYITENTPLDEVTASIIVKYSEELDVPLSLILSIIDVESKFGQFEVGAAEDRGYCQIIPQTEKWLAKNHGHKVDIAYNPARIYEPEYNIGLGVLYIHILSKAYNNDYHRVLSEYNRGPYNLASYYKKHKTYQTEYSRKILANEEKYKKI